MITKVEKLPKATIKLEVTIPVDKVKQAYQEAFDEIVKNAELPGFRKGTAPVDMVKEKTDTGKIYGEIINNLLEKYYPQAIKENMIVPVANPKVEIKEFDIDKDMQFTATVAVKPEIKIGDYKRALKESYDKRLAEAKKLNEKKLKAGEKIDEIHVHLSSNEVIDALIKTSELEVSDLLIEEETDRMMARLVDQAQTIGLSLDQYLKAQNKTSEELKKTYSISAEKNLKAEFLMSQLVKEENIEVTDEEIKEVYAASGEVNVDEMLKDDMQKWYIKSILQKNKLISKIAEEIEGENYHGHKH